MKNISFVFALVLGFAQSGFAVSDNGPQQVSVAVTEKGFEPSRLQVEAGRAVQLTITRKTDATCAKSVMIPKLKLKENLPLNKPVTLKLAKLEKGEIKFTCGMGMMESIIDVR